MAFPVDPVDLHIDLHYDGSWNQVPNEDTRTGEATSGGVAITRGASDEASQAQPGAMRLSLNNRDGKYSPRNPLSPLFGKIGRNTPLRVSVGTKHPGEADSDTTASTSHVAPSVTATKDGLLIAAWLADDVVNYTLPGSMSAGAPETDGDLSTMATAVEAVASGATGARTATASASAAWAATSAVAHGDSVAVEETLSGVGTTAVASDVTLTTSATTEAGWWLVAVQAWAWFVQDTERDMPIVPYGSGAGWIPLTDTGTVVDSINLFAWRIRVSARRVNIAGEQEVLFPGMETTNLDNHAHLLVLSGVDNWSVRFSGEASSWPPRWEVSENDVWMPVEVAGILRRLDAGAKTLQSPLRREIERTGVPLLEGIDQNSVLFPVAYWPLEDDADSDRAASALDGGDSMKISGGTLVIAFAERDDVAAGTKPLPDLLESTARLTGNVPHANNHPNDPSDEYEWVIGFLVAFEGTALWPAIEVGLGGGPFNRLRLEFSSQLELIGIDENSVETSIGTAAEDLSDGVPRWFQLSAVAGAGTVSYRWQLDASGTVTSFGSAAGITAGPVTSIVVRSRTSGTSATIGHVAMWPSSNAAVDSSVFAAVDGHTSETAGRRLERLLDEEGIAFSPVGDLDDTVAMGPQAIDTLLANVGHCADVDLGILCEMREDLGLCYRTRVSLYSQAATLTLDYDIGDVPPLEPTEDDQRLTNDVTASRPDGSSARVTKSTGSLSTQDPPDGVGVYDSAVTVHVQSDGQLENQAGWRVHLGTVDEARWPAIMVDLAISALQDAAMAADGGDVLTIDNLPEWFPPEQVNQLLLGHSETIDAFVHEIVFNGAPDSPFTVGVWAAEGITPDPDAASRWNTDQSETAAAFVAGTDTIMSVATTQGPLWTHDPGDFPFDIASSGAVLKVHAVGEILNSNPFMLDGVTGWYGFNATIEASTAVVRAGYASALVTPDGVSGFCSINHGDRASVTAGNQYLAVGWVNSAAGWPEFRAAVDWYNGGSFLSSSLGSVVAAPAGAWTVLFAEVTAVASATQAEVRVFQGDNPSASDTWHTTAIMLIPVSTFDASPQTFTVDQTPVNGVNKLIPSGSELELSQLMIWAL